ncbi:MAG: hypothetical protein R2852_06865 [Bacteroidia bacterium]
MDKNKLKQLNEKRMLLQVELRLKEIQELIKAQLTYLWDQEFSYTLHYEHEYLNWIKLNVPIRKRDGYDGVYDDFQIDVDDSLCKDSVSYAEKEFHSEHFKAEFNAFLSDEIGLVLCYSGEEPEIEISLRAFLSNPSLFFARPENWIITKDKQSIIEYIWEQGVIRFIQLNNGKLSLRKIITVKVD